MHLRLEGDGSGLLMVNASKAFHLNPTAASMAYLHLEGCSGRLSRAGADPALPREQIRGSARLPRFGDQLALLSDPDEHCPICELDLETTAPFSDRPSAPYRMDLAITYRCNNNCAHCYNARPRQRARTEYGQWKQILDRLWEVGIPHIVFTGGEPTLRPDLPELIAYAEKNGQITGINTNGRRLKDPDFVRAGRCRAGSRPDHARIA